MRSFKGLTLVVDGLTLVGVLSVLVVAATTVPATAAGPAKVTKTYTVGGSTVPGLTTGLVLAPNLPVTITATGGVCPFGTSFCPGPNGYAPWDTTQSSYGGFPLPGAPAWGLVARVGSGSWVQVGTGPTPLSGSGVLQFAVNDDLLTDNTGSFTVTVSGAASGTGCTPGWGNGDKNHVHAGPPGKTGDACRPGWGNGDANHDHSGPPGQANGGGTASTDAAPGHANGAAKGNAKH